jgi:hypothetical protein
MKPSLLFNGRPITAALKNRIKKLLLSRTMRQTVKFFICVSYTKRDYCRKKSLGFWK